MDAEFDYDLTPHQWEMLKALRLSARGYPLNPLIVGELVSLGLAAVEGNRPLITPKGRSVLLRGSPRLLDLAA